MSYLTYQDPVTIQGLHVYELAHYAQKIEPVYGKCPQRRIISLVQKPGEYVFGLYTFLGCVDVTPYEPGWAQNLMWRSSLRRLSQDFFPALHGCSVGSPGEKKAAGRKAGELFTAIQKARYP